ncbi:MULTISPECIES: hypothetical protein [Pirellulaceae]|nr:MULTISPECIES: hypothetical protein [Pirellulaceae]
MAGIGMMELLVLAILGGGCLVGVGVLITVILLVVKNATKEK